MHSRAIYNSDHELFRASARRFFREELEPILISGKKRADCQKNFG